MTARGLVERLYPSARLRELAAGQNKVFRVTENETETSIVKVYPVASREKRERHALEALAGIEGVPTIYNHGIDGEMAWLRMSDGGSWNLFANTMKTLGIEARFVDPSDPENFRRATDERTRAYFAETLPNPKLEVFPIGEVAAIGRELGVPLIVDNTAAPIICRPFDHGAAVIVLVLLDIGYMRGRWGFVLDAPWVYLALGCIGAAALVYRAWELWSVGYIPLPQQSPGLALAAAGVALVLYGAGSGFGVPRRY